MYVYYPSCNFTAMRPRAAEALARLLKDLPQAGCCRVDRTVYGPDPVGLYLCQACRETLEPQLPLESLWVYLDELDVPLPDWSGLSVTVQDCWRDREHPEIHRAVRELLRKMHVETAELDGEARERSVFCGDLHFEPHQAENRDLLAQYGGSIYQMPEAVNAQLMREQAEKFGGGLVLTYCNRCTRGLERGGARAVHLAELVTGTYSEHE